jgi:tetratricopeptide (TPR) repeat protein
MARIGARGEESTPLFERAIALFEAAGARHAAARVGARLAESVWDLGRLEDGLERMNSSFELLADEEPDADLAMLAAQVGRFLFFGGQPELASQRIETALAMAEALVLPEVLAQALTTKGVFLTSVGRRQEALALMQFAVETALEHDKPSTALRASYNLADCFGQADRYSEAADVVRQGLAQARRVGNRYWELSFLGQLYPFLALGEWDEALAMFAELPVDSWAGSRQAFSVGPLVNAVVLGSRGQLDELRALLARFDEMGTSGDEQERSAYQSGIARFELASGNPDRALPIAEEAFKSHRFFGVGGEQVKEAFATAGEAGLLLGDLAKVRELVAFVDRLPAGDANGFLRAQSTRFRAHLAATEDRAEADRLFTQAAALFRELSLPFPLAVVQTEHAELLLADGTGDANPDTLTPDAHAIFERLGAQPWIDRLNELRGQVVA